MSTLAKTNEPIPRNFLTDGWTEGRTDPIHRTLPAMVRDPINC